MVMGSFAAVGHWLLVLAHARAPAATLSPFMYSQIVWMLALGYVLFGDWPDLWTFVGAAVVIASGLYLLYREQMPVKDRRQRQPPEQSGRPDEQVRNLHVRHPHDKADAARASWMPSTRISPLHRLWEARTRRPTLREIGPRIRGVATGASHGQTDATLFDHLPNVEIIASYGVGYDNVDATEAARRGIVVTNTPDVLNDEVADLTIGLLIATLRQIPQADRYLRAGHWLKAAFPLSPTLRGRRVGIVGLGRIGKAIAPAARGLRCRYRLSWPEPSGGCRLRLSSRRWSAWPRLATSSSSSRPAVPRRSI